MDGPFWLISFFIKVLHLARKSTKKIEFKTIETTYAFKYSFGIEGILIKDILLLINNDSKTIIINNIFDQRGE